jgi:hypothetical protein
MDITLDHSAAKIVVEGSVTNELKHQSIRLTQSTDYFYNDHSPAVSGATVIVTDGSNSYKFNESEPGMYYSESAFAGVPGNTYELNITYESKTYTASSTMQVVVPIDSIGLEKASLPIEPGVILDQNKSYYNILLYCQEPGATENYYMMDAYKNGKLITDTINKKNITDDLMYNGSYIYGVKSLQIVSDPGDTIMFQLSSIDRQYCLFLVALRESGMNGSPFTGPASNAVGNISNGALGYFYTAAVSKSTNIVK